jgi:hypothetical protein
MASVAPTWIVLARDVSESVVVSGQRRTMVAAVLDAATGMVVNVTPGTSLEDVLRRALKGALVRPAAPLSKAVPELLVCPPEIVDAVRSAATALTKLAAAQITEGAGMDDAEEIFDSIVGHMEGRAQPVDSPSVGDWRILYDALKSYVDATPWRRWTDSDWFRTTLEIGGASVERACLVLGNAGLQYGFNAVADPVMFERLAVDESSRRDPLQHMEQALVVHLDPWRETKGVYADKARRYGWSSEERLVPSLLTVRDGGPADLSCTDARLLTLALQAVLTEDARRLTVVKAPSATTTGEVVFDDGSAGLFRVTRPR